MQKGQKHSKEAKLLIGKAVETAWTKRLQAIELLKEIENNNVSVEEVLQFIRSKPLVKNGPATTVPMKNIINRDNRIVTDVHLEFKGDKLK